MKKSSVGDVYSIIPPGPSASPPTTNLGMLFIYGVHCTTVHEYGLSWRMKISSVGDVYSFIPRGPSPSPPTTNLGMLFIYGVQLYMNIDYGGG